VKAFQEGAGRLLADVQRRLESTADDVRLEALLQEKTVLLRKKRASEGA